MSRGELERVEVMGRVAKEELKLTDAAAMLQLSYRQVKRLWGRYRQKGSKGLQHGNVGRVSNRGKPGKFRRRVLSLIRQK
jgi:transposase